MQSQLRIMRIQKNLTQAKLASMIQSHQTLISKYEKNLSKPSVKNMQKLAIALDVDLKTILECFYGGPNEIKI